MGAKHLNCKNCGYNNDDNAKFCERCGAELKKQSDFRRQPPIKDGMSNTNIILIIAVIVLIASLGLTTGMLLTNKGPVANNTTNISVGENNAPSSTQNNAQGNGPELIDSNSISGNSDIYGHFSYEWKTYKNSDYNLVIYSIFTNEQQKNLKQTGTLTTGNPGYVRIIVEPKASGSSSWASETSKQNYATIVDFYWGYFRQQYLMKGPIH